MRKDNDDKQILSGEHNDDNNVRDNSFCEQDEMLEVQDVNNIIVRMKQIAY